MYHYVKDKEFLQSIKRWSGKIMQSLCHYLKETYDIGANFYLVGSASKNLILQTPDRPVDLDYNLEVVRCADFNDCRYLKECARKAFNSALQKHHLHDCQDSTSALRSQFISISTGNNYLQNSTFLSGFYGPFHNTAYRNTNFSIDVCITMRATRNTGHYRLIHERAYPAIDDRYYWNMAPHSARLNEKVDYIKKHGKWELVRQGYLDIKNNYLFQQDSNHPSFICYIEAVNNVYNARAHW